MFLFIVGLSFHVLAQSVITDPFFPKADQAVTLTFNVEGTELENYPWDNVTNPIYLWAWLPQCTQDCNVATNVNPATSAQDAVKCSRVSSNVYQITIQPTIFFGKSIEQIGQMGVLLKGIDWSNGQTPDFIINFNNNDEYLLAVKQPSVFPYFVNAGQNLTIEAHVTEPSSISIAIDGSIVSSVSNSLSIVYNPVASSAGTHEVKITASNGTTTRENIFDYVVRNVVIQSRPAGIIPGINYSADHTKATLCVWAPDKTSVYVRGDFNNWKINSSYSLKKDGEFFWIQLTGLTPGVQYAYQFLIDEKIWIADPYADMILDPDDQYIPSSIYPNLKQFPEKALTTTWYFNRVSVLQTAQTPYDWKVKEFTKPRKEDLVIYELLVRDLFDSNNRSYQSLLDTISYFKRLGINAVQLMPIMEFGGNDSWGYNPTFMFAPDKAYGSKEKLKAFIDKCHQENIAVILDIAMNHQDIPNPYVLMDFDFSAFVPNQTNKWFNPTATHPFSVFFDMNHESEYTKAYLDTVNYYWLKEYKIDGYRFDLSKGFTQVNSGSDVGAWGQYDPSRITLLKRMADRIWENFPDAYIILEHLSENTEEKELAEYRKDEGKGMLLWGNMNYNYNQNTMAFSDNSDISWSYYKSRGWSVPHVISYMESHDEERLMYRNKQEGVVTGNYSTRTKANSLDRMKGAAAFYFSIPGPKMIWQFGELGYDISIDEGGRTGAKPVKWDYLNDVDRQRLLKVYAALAALKVDLKIFETNDVGIFGGNTLVKQITLKNTPYTTTPLTKDELNIQVVGNFGTEPKLVSISFPHAGKWFHYFSKNDLLEISSIPYTLTLQPGEVRFYTDFELPQVEAELFNQVRPSEPTLLTVEEVDGFVDINWIDNSNLETGFSIFRSIDDGDFVKIADVPSNTTIYTDRQLSALTKYEYYVSANNVIGSGNSEILGLVTSDAVTSSEDDFAKMFQLYPNPTGSLVYTNSNFSNYSVRVFNVLGELQRLEITEKFLNFSLLPSGVYIVEIKDYSGGMVKSRIVKQ